MKWEELSMSEKAEYMKMAIQGGLKNLDDIKESFNNYSSTPKVTLENDNTRVDNSGPVDFFQQDMKEMLDIIQNVNQNSDANFVKRLKQKDRDYIENWEDPSKIATHKLSYVIQGIGEPDIVYPDVQEIDGKLYDFTDPKNGKSWRDAFNRAVETGDTIHVPPGKGGFFTTHYKAFYPKFNKHDGGGGLNAIKNSLKNLSVDALKKMYGEDRFKDIVYSIMVNDEGRTSGTDRREKTIINAINNSKEKASKRGDYYRNLASLYVYGNDLGQFEEAPELRNVGVEYDSYLRSVGRNPDDIKIYKGDIPMDITLPEELRDWTLNFIQSDSNKTYGANSQELEEMGVDTDDVAGFLQRLSLDEDGNPVVVNSDLWDFDKGYAEKYGVDPVKVKLLDEAGTPFILKDVRPVNFVDRDEFIGNDEFEYNGHNSNSLRIANDLGYLNPLEVVLDTETGKQYSKGYTDIHLNDRLPYTEKDYKEALKELEEKNKK